MGQLFGKITQETPKFSLVFELPDYQIRQYSQCIVAETTFTKGSELRAYNRLFMFFNGKNYSKKTGKRERIEMTAPVFIQQDFPEGGGDPVHIMRFYIPSRFTSIDDIPVPKDTSVKLKTIPEKVIAVRGWKGSVRKSKIEKNETILMDCLRRDGKRMKSPPILARYNPPWTIPAQKWNEIWIELEDATGGGVIVK